jgi:hypothetical protein
MEWDGMGLNLRRWFRPFGGLVLVLLVLRCFLWLAHKCVSAVPRFRALLALLPLRCIAFALSVSLGFWFRNRRVLVLCWKLIVFVCLFVFLCVCVCVCVWLCWSCRCFSEVFFLFARVCLSCILECHSKRKKKKKKKEGGGGGLITRRGVLVG